MLTDPQRANPGPPPTSPPDATHERSVDDRTGLPQLVGPHVRLTSLGDRELPAVHRLVNDPAVRAGWRARGAYLGAHQLQSLLTTGVLASMVAIRTDDPGGAVVGLVELLDPVLVDRRASLSAVVAPRVLGTPIGVEMSLLLVQWAFDAYPLDKVQIEVHAANRRLVPGLARHLRLEGRLVRHLCIQGEWHDVDVFALWRDDLPQLLAAAGLAPRPVPAAGPPGDRWRSLLADAGVDLDRSAGLRLADLDSLLVVELLVMAEDVVGHPIALEAFHPVDTTLADVVAFCDAHSVAATR